MPNRSKILIVDDAPSNVRLLQAVLEDRYDIFSATSGEEGIRLAQECMPDLILLDVVMPDISGVDVCIRLKEIRLLKDIPVIFVTGKGDVADEERGFEAGGVDYLTKPICKPIVRARVRNHLELKHHRDLLEQLSIRDGLTGIPNRRHYDLCLEREWRRSVRNKTSICLVMVDIDNFKKYNDRYGHLAGDDCLKRVAEALNATPGRPTDVVARYGGEEFSAVLPETSLEGALQVAENMRCAVEALDIPHEDSEVGHVTVSIGVACASPDAEAAPLDLQKRADDALYRAKTRGRNQVAGHSV